MKKGRKITALLLAMVAAGAMTAGLAACGGNEDPGQQGQTTEAEKLKDGGAVVFTEGKATIDLTQYVKANGNAYRVASSNPSVATAAVSGNTLTVTEVGTGSAIITVACGNVQLTFSVVVADAFYTVTLDGVAVPPEAGEKWAAGSSYTLPVAKESDDPNMEFKGWNVNGEVKQAGEEITVNKNLTITAVFERKAAVEVNGHAQSVSLNEGGTATVTIADYITAYGRAVTASAVETDIVTVSVQDGVVTLTGVAQGTATLTLSTEGVTVNIQINVLSADMPTFANVTLDVDLFTQESNSIDFAPNEPSGEHAYAYVYSLRTQDAKASITDGTLTYTPGADYDIKEDGATVSLVVEAAVTIDGNAAGTVTFTVTVRIKDTAPAAPTFENVTETFDPFSANGYTLTLKADDENFIYTYEIGGVSVTGSKTYTTEAVETVNVTYTYKGNTEKHGTASFTVKVSFDRTSFPTLIEESKSADIDLAEVQGGVYTVDLFGNFTNAENISGYTVNGTAHTDGTEYTISNTGNTYGETATEVTYTVVATISGNLGSLTYTYTVNVKDTSAFRIENGGFENAEEGKPTGWTGATGRLDNAETYWEKYSMNNDGQYYNSDTADTETLTSSSFTVGGSGWITFKFGAARPIAGSDLRNVHLEFYGEGDELIADVRNVLFADPEAALKLNDYKLNLSAFKGKTVYVKAVDGEEGNGDFRFMILDAFVTYWKEAPTDAKYTDLTATRYFNPTVRLDLNDANTVTLNPVLSQGLVSNPALTATVDKQGLTVDATNPLVLTATKKGNYTVTYQLDGETVFTANVTVENSADNTSVVNGGFETGDLTGWTVVEGTGADIISGVSYWEGDTNMQDHNGVTVNSFMKDGTHFLHTNEAGTLILKSSEFVLGGDGYISFKLGGAKNSVSYVALCDAETDEELIRVTNEYFNDPCLPMAMVRRFMNASQYMDQSVYIKIVDGATSDFGMLTFDALQVSLTQAEAQAIIDADKAWAATYRQDVLDNAGSITGAHTVNIINYIRNYYQQLTLPSAPSED